MTPKRQESLELVLLLLVMPIFGWCGPRATCWAVDRWQAWADRQERRREELMPGRRYRGSEQGRGSLAA
jgi:hypothetical protein